MHSATPQMQYKQISTQNTAVNLHKKRKLLCDGGCNGFSIIFEVSMYCVRDAGAIENWGERQIISMHNIFECMSSLCLLLKIQTLCESML